MSSSSLQAQQAGLLTLSVQAFGFSINIAFEHSVDALIETGAPLRSAPGRARRPWQAGEGGDPVAGEEAYLQCGQALIRSAL